MEIVQAAKDVTASHDMLLDLFGRMDDFFRRLKIYSQSCISTELAEVLVKVAVKVLKILSIATKEVEQSRASGSFLYLVWILLTFLTIYLERYIKRLAGRKDIENAVAELESVIQREHYTATTQVLEDTRQLRRGT